MYRGIIIVVCCIGLLLGCASIAPERVADWRQDGQLPTHVELTSVPFFPQDVDQCGPAALATVLVYRDVETDPEVLRPRIFIPARGGSLQPELVATARQFDMLVYPLRSDLGAVLQEITAGNPVLVLQNLAFGWLPRWHYAVAIGFDLEAQTIILRSGTQARWITPLATFEATWQRAGGWAILIVPPGRIPTSAEPEPYLRASADLEDSDRLPAAHQAYRAATARWPQHPLAWAGAANSAYRSGVYLLAVNDFGTALSLDPRNAALWNNYGYALAALGCHADARAAARCALALDPDDPNLRASVVEIAQSSATMAPTQAAACPALVCPIANGQ